MFFTLLIVFSGISAFLIEAVDAATTILVPKFWVIFGFLAGLTMIAYAVSWMGLQKGVETSVNVLMGGITIKLLLSMVLVLVYLQKNRVDSVLFATEFFSLYFLFTAFEVYALLLNLRHQNKI